MNKIAARIVLTILLLITCIPIVLYFTGNGGSVSPNENAQFEDMLIPDEDPLLDEEQATEIVLGMLPKASEDDIQEFEQSYEEGGWMYEGTIKSKKIVYAFRIDGDNGNLLKWTVEKKLKD